MTAFWLWATGMVVFAVALVTVPIWRHRSSSDISRRNVNTDIFRERLAELETEQREGRLDSEHYQQLRAELERTLLLDAGENNAHPSQNNGLIVWAASLAALLLPILGLSYYYFMSFRGEAGDWIALQNQLGPVAERLIYEPSTVSEQDLPTDLPNLTRVLQARVLKGGMNDPEGLYLLGASYMQLQQAELAAVALKRAYELAPDQPNITLAYAEAMLFANKGKLNNESNQLLRRLLQTNPQSERVLFLLGWGSFNANAYQEAVRYWQTLLALRDPDSEGAQVLRNSIAEAQARQAELNKPSVAQQQTPSSDGPSIAVTVDVSPNLRSKLSADATLFIFAKAVSGPPMPLAAVRQPARDFPVQVVLDDKQAMMPSMKLSQFEQVVVGARISKSGDVTAQSGDLQSLSDTLNLTDGAQSVALVIDQIVP
jgi:cytochrome c-type biogenesis protein CcmH